METKTVTTTTIKQYLRKDPIKTGTNKRGEAYVGEPLGVMMATLVDGKIKFGWSVCHYRDTFNKKKGIMIAERRMNHFVPDSPVVVPQSMFRAMIEFMDRAERQFFVETYSPLYDGFELAISKQRTRK